MFNNESSNLDSIDWAKLEDVKWLLDRQQGLTAWNKRKLYLVSKYGEGASPRTSTSSSSSSPRTSIASSQQTTETDIAYSAWADRHVGSADLPLASFGRDFVLAHSTAVIPAKGGLFPGLRSGCWILYHSHGRLYWGLVRNPDPDRRNVPRDRRRVHITTSRWLAGLYREEGDSQLPNLIQLLNSRRWARNSSDRPCESTSVPSDQHYSSPGCLSAGYDATILVSQIRGIVDARYLRRVTRRVPNESYLAPTLAKFDYIVAKHPDRRGGSDFRYCGGWIISDPNSKWLKIWTERNEVRIFCSLFARACTTNANAQSDCVSPIVRMNRYYWIPRQDVIRVLHAAGVAMRMLEVGDHLLSLSDSS